MSCKAAVVWLACAVCAHAAGYTTYIGDAYTYQVSAIATDANGNTYVTGSRAVVPATPFAAAVTDVFIGKVDASGNFTLVATFSGKGSDQANGIAVDPTGNIYIVGATTSTDFPLRQPLQSTAAPIETTGFLMKLAADGTVVYSTYLGGTLDSSAMNGVAADANGDAYVTGTTLASDYPHTPGLPASVVEGGQFFISGAFFAKISPAGDRILYAGALAADESDCGVSGTCFFSPIPTGGYAITVDPAGNAYIAGDTGGQGLPTTPGALVTQGVGAFIAKVNAAGNGTVYVTLLGGGNYIPEMAFGSEPANAVNAIAADADGNAYIAGYTWDPAFPVTASAFQTMLASQAPVPNAFVAKLNPTGTAMVWATLLGGSGGDGAQTVAPDFAGNVWVSGTTQPIGFPDASGFLNGSEFLVELNPSGSALTYSALFPSDTVATGLALDPSGTIHAAGATGLISAFMPGSLPGQTTAPWLFGVANSAGGPLAGRIAPGELISLYGLNLGPATPVTGTFDAAGFLPATLGGVTVTIHGAAAPLLYVSDTQINAVAPIELSASSTVDLNFAVLTFRTIVDSVAPQVFRNPDGSAAAINQDGTVNSQTNPAKVGSYVSIWATGTGYFPGSDGQMATGANSFCSLPRPCVIFDASGTQVDTSYSGAAPDLVNGVIQINFQVTSATSYYLAVVGLGSAADSDLFEMYTAP